MATDASRFITNRTKIISITNDRITTIIWYVIECYQLLQRDKPTYSKSWIRTQTTHKPEDYLKMEFVDKYLIPNKAIIHTKISELYQINFSYEPQKRYIDTADGKQKVDKIDIYINKLGLQNEWKEPDENVYFAIECKRIEILSDTRDYVSDIRKFTQRNHTNLRLPFEGMIAFIENKNLTHKEVSAKVSDTLRNTKTIKTKQYLVFKAFHSGFDGSYTSSHKKNYGNNEDFSIYHLLFDYSTLVSK